MLYIRNVLFRISTNISYYRGINRKFRFIFRRNISYSLFPLVPLFDYKYENFRDRAIEINDGTLIKLYKEFQKSNRDDLEKPSLYEKIVEVLLNIDLRFLNEENKAIYLYLLLISTNYCSTNKDLKLESLISKLIIIFSTYGRFILDTFPKNSESKNLITKLKQYHEWNFTSETLLDNLIKFLLSIKCTLNGGKLNVFEKSLLLEMNRKRLYNLYISSFYSDLYYSKGGCEINFVTKWLESLYYLIVINVIYAYGFIKLIESYDNTIDVEDSINNIVDKREVRNIRSNIKKNLTEVEIIQPELNLKYVSARQAQKSHSEWSYSGNSTIFQLDRGRYSPTRSDYLRQLPKCTMEEPLWPE